MGRDIEILKKGRLEKSLQLGNGTYTMGRNADADIVLADSAVSKTHATLTIDNNSFLIKDSGSANGIHLQGKKFIEKTFQNGFEIEIKPFTIRTAADAHPKTDKNRPEMANAVRNFSINNIKSSIFLLFGITMLLTVLIGYIPLKNKAASIARQETLKTGILLTRYLAEMNRPFLEAGETTMIRTSPVRLEDGVIYAFMVDAHGRIIAPREKQGDFVDWAGLSGAFAGAELKIEDGKQNEKIIFYPVIQQNQTIGAAIIGFAWQQAGVKTSSGMGPLAVSLIAILSAISLAMAHLLTKAFLNPLKSLYEDVEVAIKNGSTSLDYQAPYKELDNLKRAFDRLLKRKTDSLPSVAPDTVRFNTGAAISPSSPDKKSALPDTGKLPASPPKTLADKGLLELTVPWCIVDRESYTIVRFSDNFVPGLGTKECGIGMHIIEALEADIIPAVSQMIDSEGLGEQKVTHKGKSYKLRRIPSEAGKNDITLVFEDTAE